MKPDAISKLISDLDVRISELQKQSDKYKNVLGLNNPKVVIDGLIIFAKTFKKVLQTTSNVKKAVEAAYKSLKKYLAGKVSPIEADIIIDEVKESVGEINKLDEATINKIKDALTESLENYDKKQDQANFKAEAKKLKNNLVNKAIENSKIYYAKTKNSPSRIDTKVADKLVVDAVKFAEAIPAEAHAALGIKGKPYTDIVGTHKRNFDIAGKKLKGPDKGKPGRYKNKFDNLKLKSADQLIADGTWSAETAAIWNNIDMSKVQPLNSKATNLSPLLTKIKNILAGKTDAQTVAEKKSAIDKIYDPSIGINNLKFAELNASILKDGYLNGSLSLDYVINALQAQTNVTAGFRAFTDIGGIEIKAGKIDLSTFKGEHLQSNSQTMSEILGWIVSPNSTSLQLKSILSGHTQIFGDKTKLFDPIDTTFSKTSRLGAERLTRGLAKNTVESIYVPGTKTDFLTDAAQNEYRKQVQELGEAAKKASTVLNKGEQFIKNNPDAIPTVADPVILDRDINKMIKDTKGIAEQKRFSDVVAKRRGASVRNFRLISSGAQDFNGLMYDLYGKGKLGEQQQAWVKKNLVKPYQDGIANIDKYRQALKNDYATLLKKFPEVTKKLGKIVPDTEFTFDQALRVNLWTTAGFETPGLSKRDTKKLNDIVNKDPELKLFNEAALEISKQDTWVEPSAYWDTESLISDLNNLTNKVGRKQFLADFITNSDVIFSKENLNKMEVALGTNWRDAMEDSLYRMRNGTKRPAGTNKLTNNFLNWVNNSVGAIMFFNIKSALLQTISSVNFLNWSDNNPYKAAMAFGNQPQFWSDFTTLWNSPKLKQRRSGLRKDVNEAELANAAKGATNKASAALSYLLKLGFTPTQMADSFAIASGGATFYRNRINTLKKQGLDQKAAEEQAFADFAEASDVAQQSADPMLISSQQASPLGRLILAFQNTPAQVTRIFNKSARDFINNRGDQKTNISKMIYYGAVQGFIFATLQNAAFALIPGFDDEEKDEEEKAKDFDKKEERILNSMVDTMLRGSGVYGAIVATLKNTAATYYREEQKSAFGKDHTNTLTEIMNLSPPVGSKLRKINNAIKAKEYNSEVVKEQGWDVTLKGKVNLSPSYQVIASLTEAITNLPLERAVVEIDRVVEMLDARNTTFQRVALALGYRTWDVGTKNEERDLVKIESKEAKEKARKQKVIDDRAERKRLKELEKYKGKTKEEIKQMKRKDSIVDTNKSDQVKSLINLGLTKKQIKELKYEDDRVNKIIELTNK